MKIIVLGALGQLGQAVVKDLNESLVGGEIYPITKETCDISDQSMLKHFFDEIKPTHVINCAAYTDVENAEIARATAWKVNADGPLFCAELAEQFNCVLIHISTDYVFDGEKNRPYFPEDKANPLSYYGESKYQGELNIIQHCQRHIIIRTSWLFSREGKNFVNTISKLLLSKSELKIISDQTGGPTSVTSLAEAITTVVTKTPDKNVYGTYHYCNEPYVSWYEFAKGIKKIMRESGRYSESELANIVPITTDEYGAKAKRPENSCLDCHSFIDTFNFKQIGWEAVLSAYMSEKQDHVEYIN